MSEEKEKTPREALVEILEDNPQIGMLAAWDKPRAADALLDKLKDAGFTVVVSETSK